jgi:hypothetical protein
MSRFGVGMMSDVTPIELRVPRNDEAQGRRSKIVKP